MTVREVFNCESCAAGSDGIVKVLFNDEIGVFAVDVTDDDGDRVMVAFSSSNARLLADRLRVALEKVGA